MGTTNFDTVVADAFVDGAAGIGVGVTLDSGVPAGDPGNGNHLYLDTDDGTLYTWDGAAWNAVGGGVAGITIDTVNDSVAIGDGAVAGGLEDVAIGDSADSGTGGASIVIGRGASVDDVSDGTAIGYTASVTGLRGTAIGSNASAADNGTAIGAQSNAGANGVAIGRNVSASDDRVVIGGATTVAMFGGSFAIEVVGSPPAGDPGEAGVIRFNTGDNKLYVWTGATWKSVTLA